MATTVSKSDLVGNFMQIRPGLVRALGGKAAQALVFTTIAFRSAMFGYHRVDDDEDSGDKHVWWLASHEELSNDTGLSVSAVRTAVAGLVKADAVKVQKHGQKRSDHTLSYRLLFTDGELEMTYREKRANSDVRELADEAEADVPELADEAEPDVPELTDHDVRVLADHDVRVLADLPYVQEGEEGEEAPLPLMDRCVEHATVLIPPSCGGCAAVRKAREQAEKDALHATHRDQRERVVRERQRREDDLRVRAEEIARCGMCDDGGRVNGRGVCDHDPMHEATTTEGAASARAVLRSLGLPATQRVPVPA